VKGISTAPRGGGEGLNAETRNILLKVILHQQLRLQRNKFILRLLLRHSQSVREMWFLEKKSRRSANVGEN
jgi:hypothetical protein